MRHWVFWSWIRYICIVFFLLEGVPTLHAKEVKTQIDHSKLANYHLPGFAIRTVEEALALPDDQIDLTTAILLLSQEAYRNLYQINIDVDQYRDRIDEMAMALVKKIGKEKDPEKIIEVINHYLFQELNFTSISEEIGSKDFFLNFILSEKRGNCLGLSILYLAIAERIGLPLYGVAVPTHFFVRYEDGRKRFNIETTASGISYPDGYYTKEFNIPVNSQFYLKSLGERETIGALYTTRGVAYGKKGLYDQAIADYDKALEINPGYAEAYYNRGIAYKSKGLYDLAITDYTQALEINPRDAEVYNNRGNTYSEKGLYDLAIADFNKALEINPGYAEAYYNRGIAYDNKGLSDLAITDYTQALEINPRDAEVYNNRGIAYDNKGLSDLAIADYDKALKINPGYAKAYYNKAIIFEKVGRIEEAVEAYKEFIHYALSSQYASEVEIARQRIQALEGEVQ